MIDLHCHILPGVDDGPTQWDEAMRMARMAAADGIRTIIATPHVVDPVGAANVIRLKVEELNRRLAAEVIDLEVLPGAEVSPLHPPEALTGLTLNGTAYVLVEFPHSHLPRDAFAVLSRLASGGLRPVVAHPERNPSVIRNPALLFELVEAGALCQVTAASLSGGMGAEARACARYLLKKGVVHFLASDAHSAHHRPPNLTTGLRAAAKLIGKDAAQRLVSANPQAVVSGGHIP